MVCQLGDTCQLADGVIFQSLFLKNCVVVPCLSIYIYIYMPLDRSALSTMRPDKLSVLKIIESETRCHPRSSGCVVLVLPLKVQCIPRMVENRRYCGNCKLAARGRQYYSSVAQSRVRESGCSRPLVRSSRFFRYYESAMLWIRRERLPA